MAQDGKAAGDGSPPLLEWVAAGLGGVVTLTLLGFIGWQAVRAGDDAPPAIALRVAGIAPAGAGWVVEVAATNLSAATAATLGIEGQIVRDGAVIETAEASIDYVPGKSERRGGLFFQADPADGEVVLRPLGYEEP